MRLLNVSTLELYDFTGDDVPPYAALSHIWANGEVSYHDIINGDAPLKIGFRKIQHACRQAIKDNLDWTWIDTCCVDRTSSAETTEAINSMYQYFRQAAWCYVFLADVFTVDDALSEEDRYHQLRRSKWFTRGWTLQELIAPPRTLFFDNAWNLLGSKGCPEFDVLLSEISGVPASCIEGLRSPLEFNVATRMSWASQRRCARKEDEAYCLLGLFDINLPLIYGEGGRAFVRLQEEILRTTSDQSLFMWTVDEGNPRCWKSSSVFAESPEDFRIIGRKSHILREPSTPATVTQLGLSISLPVAPVSGRDAIYGHPDEPAGPFYEAYLNCEDDLGGVAKIYLRPVEGGNEWQRPNSFHRIATPFQHYGIPSEYDAKDIFIKTRLGFRLHNAPTSTSTIETPHSFSSLEISPPIATAQGEELKPRIFHDMNVIQNTYSAMTIESLEDILYEWQVESLVGRSFIPEGVLEKILDRETIKHICGTLMPVSQASASLVDRVMSSSQKIFVVLILSGLSQFTSFVIDSIGLTDEHLPMPDPKLIHSKSPPGYLKEQDSHSWSQWKIVTETFARKSYSQRFFEAQWQVLAPVFKTKHLVSHLNLTANHILPYLKQHLGQSATVGAEDDQVRNGSFSDIRKVVIHPNHYSFGDYGLGKNTNNVFAVKRLHAVDRMQFELEREALTQFREGRPRHIVQLLATYEVRTGGGNDLFADYYMIFPWADGTLRSFWGSQKAHVGDVAIIPWLLRQCLELAKALELIHEGRSGFPHESSEIEPVPRYGRHGDVKPTNILWFPNNEASETNDLGSLVLGDFGLARFHRRDSRSNLTSTDIPRSMTYSAPEFSTQGRISRSVDIWALGCVFLEFITWFLEGEQAVTETFPDLRCSRDSYGFISDTFFEVFEKGKGTEKYPTARLKPRVQDWIERLHRGSTQYWYIHKFLALTLRMLDTDPLTRIRASKVAFEMEDLHRKCLRDMISFPTRSSRASKLIEPVGHKTSSILRNVLRRSMFGP
ncbi:hypothetical protein JX265_011461 [Neoarthrinium moseri]|uniref:Protein kinase domain-containing protein n=1 Tax=Neoarthrinium moseri TaxID=1658444 RepID=A0A9P9WCI8_9PEZI|nr:hypothetical protein JX266_001886 [Neoarthrinium moseri]KAI1856820.1 hypothetical protein JX265_011461 [Neoarthrinium moseri]